jgi:hypothetical protein
MPKMAKNKKGKEEGVHHAQPSHQLKKKLYVPVAAL